jgi:DNA polymerase-3 subunit gamma/tau
MLGTIDEGFLFELLEAIAAGDAKSALAVADGMEARNLSFDAALQDLASLLHRIALVQVAPRAADDVDAGGYTERIKSLAGRIGPEDVQLYYQIAIHGREDLPLAPDEYAGFTMTLLRMFAFRPESAGKSAKAGAFEPADRARPATKAGAEAFRSVASRPPDQPAEGVFDGDWPALARQLDIGGLAKQLAQQSELRNFDGAVMTIAIAPEARHLAEKGYQEKLRNALSQHFGAPIRLQVETNRTGGITAQDQAVAAINEDAFVRDLLQQFDATVIATSINPAQPRSKS